MIFFVAIGLITNPDSVSGSLGPSSSHDSSDRSDSPDRQSRPTMLYGSPSSSDLHDTASKKTRVARNDQGSVEYLKRVGSLARLYNAISLQSELMNGTKTPEDAVLQLLSIGSAKVPDILEFTPDPIIVFIDEMEKTKKILGIGTIQKEEVVLAESLTKSYASIGSFTEARSVDEYKNTISDFYDAIQYDGLVSILKSIKSLEWNLDKIKDISSSASDAIKKDAVYAFGRYLNDVRSWNIDLDVFEKEAPMWKKYLFLGDVESLKTLKPLEELVRISSLREYIQENKRVEDVNIIRSEFSHVSNLVNPSKNSEKMVTLLRGLIRSKTSLYGKFGGVPGLKLLADSVQKDWVEKALPHAGKVHQIVKGLQPIISLGSKLETLDSLLDRIPEPGFLKSLRLIEEYQKLLAKLPSQYDDSFANSYKDCVLRNTIRQDYYSDLKNLIKSARILHNNIRVLRSSGFIERNMKETHQKLKSMAKSIKFSDPTDISKSSEEVVGIYDTLLASGELPQMKEHLSSIIKSLEEFDANSVKNHASLMKGFDIDKYRTDYAVELQAENAVAECMKSLKNSEEASNAAKGILDLLKIGSNQMEAVKTGLDFGSKFSRGLKGLKFDSIVENMKTNEADETSKLNEMTPYLSEGLTGSEIITKVASMLHDSYEFVQFKNTVSQLDVDIEIDKLTLLDPITLKSIEDQWGNQGTFVNQLVESISNVEKFHSSLNTANSTTFEDYGAPLKGISLGKIGGGLEQKSNALEISWPYYDNKEEKMKQEKAKKMIDEMSVLDLDFASHKPKFDGAQEVLEHLQTFLTKFIEDIEASEALKVDNTTKIVIIVVGVSSVLIVIGGAVLAYMGIFKKGCFRKEIKKEVVKEDHFIPQFQLLPADVQYLWLMRLQFDTPENAYRFHALLLTNVKGTDDMYNADNYLPATRFPKPSIQFKSEYPMNTRGYHGNRIRTRTGTVFYAMAGPTVADATHEDTQELFWETVWNDMVEYIVMLNRVCDGIVDDDGNRLRILANYFPSNDPDTLRQKTITIGKYTITEIESTNAERGDHFNNRDFTRRVLEITRTIGGIFSRRTETRRVTHYHHLNWEDDGVPRQGFQAMYEVMCVVKQSKFPIIVHCDTGTNRTMSFIGMEYIPRLVEVDDEKNYTFAFMKLAEHRLRSFDTLRNSYTLQLGVIYFYLMKLGQINTFDTYRRMYDRVVMNREGVFNQRGIKW